MFEEKIDQNKEDMIQSVCEIIKFPSISKFTADPVMPFGTACKEALEYILALGEKLGFKTKNIDGYCGYIEFGEGPELLGIIGHLDVVPADDTWTYSPFSPVVEDGKIYGRGAIDDKGPVISALYAMKAVMDTVEVTKRVRLILGLNEEKDWKCIDYYKAHEEIPTIGFSPDADFPCIYAEKGILTLYLKETSSYDTIEILDIDCHNNAINVVPKYCSIILKLSDRIDSADFMKELKRIVSKTEYEIDVYEIDKKTIKLTSYGMAAHAAHPDLGINAISRLLVVLHHIFDVFQERSDLLSLFTKYIHTEFNGRRLGLDTKDESGGLTLNVGNMSFYKNTLQIGLNIRIPVTTKLQTIEGCFHEIAEKYPTISISIEGRKKPLYLDKKNPLVMTLCNIFNRITGNCEKPLAIGGATYARAFSNCVSFGANMPGNTDMCHQADEFIKVDDLITSSKIYAEAIYELTK